MRVRIRIPGREELFAYGTAALGHAVLVVALFGFARGSAGPAQPLPSLAVALAAPRGQPGGGAATAPRPAPRPKAPAPKPPAATESARPKPRAETPPPRPAQPQPRRPAEPTARPEELPREEEEATPEPPDDGVGDATAAAAGPGSAAQGPAGVPGLPGAGGGISGVDIDAPVRADWYLTLIVNRLQDAWRDRPVLPAGSAVRQVEVSFIIRRTGDVTDAAVVTPSGYTPLDLSALRAVTSIQRLPPLPAAYGRDQVRARFVFELIAPE